MNELIQALEEYISFLEGHISSNSTYLWSHGMHPTDDEIAKGKELREKILLIKNNIKL